MPDKLQPETIKMFTKKYNTQLDILCELGKMIKDKIWELQDLCPHPADKVMYHEDPAGGHDSYFECILCGGNINPVNKKRKEG